MTIELVQQGNYGKAMKRISSSRLAPFTEQTHRGIFRRWNNWSCLPNIVNDTKLVVSLPDAHVAYLLLRHCASAQRIAFLMRNVDPASTELFCKQFDNAVIRAMEIIASIQLLREIDNIEFVYKEAPLTKLSEVADRLELRFFSI
ncbi:hypothetical protein GJ496_000787 [Pomphorhynchus laevis]|nr:hypothetical protein GJ496_000787 [Pomphorhynchus laevis]